jgi:8-oxo-dGTP pyrophosphatase MutT (NUDIX family)
MPISPYLKSLRQKIDHDLVLIPGVTALIFNDKNEILLQRAADDGNWYTIGGALDPGETPAAAAVREVLEETGLHVVPERIVGVYSDPLTTYPNGDKVLYISTCFLCRIVAPPPDSQAFVIDDETLELRYFPLHNLPQLLPTHRHRIEQALKNQEQAYFEWNEKKI